MISIPPLPTPGTDTHLIPRNAEQQVPPKVKFQMNSKEMKEKRSQLLADAQKLMFGEKVDAEIRTKVDQMLKDADAMSAVIASTEAEERSAAEQRGQKMQLPQPGEHAATETPEQRTKSDVDKSLRSYLLTGTAEKRDMGISGTGVVIPQSVADPKVAQKYAGAAYDLVFKWRTSTGEPANAPLFDDTSNGFVLNSTAISTTDPAITGPKISIDDLRSNPILIETSLLQDSAFDLVAFVDAAIQSRYQRTANSIITKGNSSNVGALTATANGITSAASGAVGYADFVALMAALDPAYATNAVWTMSNATLGKVLSILDGNQRPIFLPFNEGGSGKFIGQILGYPVRINPYLDAVAADNKPVLFGDYASAYTFREVGDGRPEILRLNERYAELKKVGFVAFARVGGALVNQAAVQALTVKA
jgi:HK97 family phage major capsid protein